MQLDVVPGLLLLIGLGCLVGGTYILVGVGYALLVAGGCLWLLAVWVVRLRNVG